MSLSFLLIYGSESSKTHTLYIHNLITKIFIHVYATVQYLVEIREPGGQLKNVEDYY